MTIFELISKRKEELTTIKEKLEKNLQPLAAVEAELDVIEKMTSLEPEPVDHSATLSALQELIK